jgi:rRNA-processing protein FCF1
MGQSNKVVLDTNMLLAIGELKIDVFSGIEEEIGKTEFFVPEEVIQELKKLKEENKTKKKNAVIAEKLIEKKCIILNKGENKNADEKMMELAGKGFIIATNDKELRKKIKNNGFKTAFVRQKKVIVVE